MKGALGTWAIGLTASVAVHLGAGAVLLAALQPEPVDDQPVPESRLNVEAQQVARSEAQQQAPPAEAADSQDAQGTALGVGALAQSVAEPVSPQIQEAALRAPNEAAADTAPSDLQPEPLAAALPVIAATSTAPLQAAATATQKLASLSAPAAAPPALPVAQQPPSGTPVVSVAPSAQNTPAQNAPSTAAPQQTPEVTASKAVLAFPAEGTVDPVSLAAFQSFTQPDLATGTDVRDSLTAALAVPCSRMQVTFDPDTTTLSLSGHIPDPAQRAPVLAALQEQMGADIRVADNLLILPAPQCGALTGIADMGLPQSTDQITNPLIVGADTHARAFRYTEGQALVIDMAGADYPAYVYLDYFDAGGNVIHLSPNDRSPLAFVEAEAPIRFGATQEGEPGLLVRIGPPYGQEIAAAFASSVPLYEGLRPIVEPADLYLNWMRERVAEARAQHADFKGEWVYFFVTTAAE